MALSTLCLCRHGSHPIVGLARGPRAQEVVVTVQGDGVLCYSADTQVGSMVAAWHSPSTRSLHTPDGLEKTNNVLAAHARVAVWSSGNVNDYCPPIVS